MNARQMAEQLVNDGLATEEEIRLVSDINGYTTETMEDILYARAGVRSFSQLSDEDDEEDYDEDDDDEDID